MDIVRSLSRERTSQNEINNSNISISSQRIYQVLGAFGNWGQILPERLIKCSVLKEFQCCLVFRQGDIKSVLTTCKCKCSRLGLA